MGCLMKEAASIFERQAPFEVVTGIHSSERLGAPGGRQGRGDPAYTLPGHYRTRLCLGRAGRELHVEGSSSGASPRKGLKLVPQYKMLVMWHPCPMV